METVATSSDYINIHLEDQDMRKPSRNMNREPPEWKSRALLQH